MSRDPKKINTVLRAGTCSRPRGCKGWEARDGPWGLLPAARRRDGICNCSGSLRDHQDSGFGRNKNGGRETR